MDKKEAISKAAEQLANGDNFVVIVISHQGKVDTTTYIDNANNALGILSTIKKIEYTILNPPQSSRIVGA